MEGLEFCSCEGVFGAGVGYVFWGGGGEEGWVCVCHFGRVVCGWEGIEEELGKKGEGERKDNCEDGGAVYLLPALGCFGRSR